MDFPINLSVYPQVVHSFIHMSKMCGDLAIDGFASSEALRKHVLIDAYELSTFMLHNMWGLGICFTQHLGVGGTCAAGCGGLY